MPTTLEIPEHEVNKRVMLEPASSALAIVDMQDDFVRDEGTLQVQDAPGTVGAISRLLELARESAMRVVFSQDSDPGDPEFEIWPAHALRETWGWETIDERTPRDGELVVQKIRYDAFYGTELDQCSACGTSRRSCCANGREHLRALQDVMALPRHDRHYGGCRGPQAPYSRGCCKATIVPRPPVDDACFGEPSGGAGIAVNGHPTGSGSAGAQRYARPPVAVFCDPSAPHALPCLGIDAREHAANVSAALAAIPAFGGPAERDAGLRVAVRATAGLVRCLSVHANPVDGEQLPTRSHVQDYFRVRSTALPAPQAALHAALVIASAIADLRNAPLAGSDLARETAAMRQVVVDLGGAEGQQGVELDDDDGQIEGVPASCQRQVWLSRWIIGHHVHVLLNVYATIALQEAIALLRAGETHLATHKLATVTTYVQGFAPARAHAATLPSDFYNVVVRPTMVPTVVPVPLSGKMHVEYQLYRKRVDELLEVLPEPVNELALPEPELAFAREELLEADLIEAERHVCLVEPVVGNERSLIQAPRSTENAVAVLRRMRPSVLRTVGRSTDELVASRSSSAPWTRSAAWMLGVAWVTGVTDGRPAIGCGRRRVARRAVRRW